MGAFTMRLLRLLLPVMILGLCLAGLGAVAHLRVGKDAEPRKRSAPGISPSVLTGKELPPGSGTAKEGAPIFAQKCAACHGATGSGGPAPMLIKPASDAKTPCLVSRLVSTRET